MRTGTQRASRMRNSNSKRHVLLIRRDANRRGSSLPTSKDALHCILRAPTLCTRARCGSVSAAILLSRHCRLASRRVSLALLPSDASPASGQSSLEMLLHSQFTGSRDGYQSFIGGWDDAEWLHWFGEASTRRIEMRSLGRDGCTCGWAEAVHHQHQPAKQQRASPTPLSPQYVQATLPQERLLHSPHLHLNAAQASTSGSHDAVLLAAR